MDKRQERMLEALGTEDELGEDTLARVKAALIYPPEELIEAVREHCDEMVMEQVTNGLGQIALEKVKEAEHLMEVVLGATEGDPGKYALETARGCLLDALSGTEEYWH